MRIWMGLETCASRAPGAFLYIYFIFTPLIFHYKQTTLWEPKRLCHPPTTIGLETHLHLSVCFFYIFLFLILLMNFIIYHNCSYCDDFNDHNHHVTPPIPHQRTATATITKTLPPSSHINVCVAIQQVNGSPRQH